MQDERTLGYAGVLSKMIQKETISSWEDTDPAKFRAFHGLLREAFPKIFGVCAFEDFDGSFLMRWKGKNPKAAPILFMNHHDVVEATGDWAYPPFSGKITEDKIWGRGALDTKGGLFCMLQAAEELAEEGFVPEQDIYFESACTEETSGNGADTISRVLEKRGIRFEMVLDEGGMIVYDPIGGADSHFAMIGVGEKGCADLKFIARSKGGHASMPPKGTPLVRLGRFMFACDYSNLFDTELSPAVAEMFARMAPTMTGVTKRIFSDPMKYKKLLATLMPRLSVAGGAMVKTTVAFTMAKGSDSTNVIPEEAYVIGNMRFSHHQGQQASFEAVKKLAKRYDLEMEILDPGFESAVTDFNGAPFKRVEAAVKKHFPDVIAAPYIMTGASDARYFSRVSDHCLRFCPFKISDEQLDSIHGVNECLDLSALAPAVDFYKTLYQN